MLGCFVTAMDFTVSATAVTVTFSLMPFAVTVMMFSPTVRLALSTSKSVTAVCLPEASMYITVRAFLISCSEEVL